MFRMVTARLGKSTFSMFNRTYAIKNDIAPLMLNSSIKADIQKFLSNYNIHIAKEYPHEAVINRKILKNIESRLDDPDAYALDKSTETLIDSYSCSSIKHPYSYEIFRIASKVSEELRNRQFFLIKNQKKQ